MTSDTENLVSCTIDLTGTIKGSTSVHEDANLIALSNFIQDLDKSMPTSTVATVVHTARQTLEKIALDHGTSIMDHGLHVEMRLSKVDKDLVLKFDFKIPKD
jgi:predicted regulator of Ras-like GTPase activity (Roadblock/LC7/MglB family)